LVSVNETIAPSNINLYPNPANGMVFIYNNKALPAEKYTITLTDVTGRTVSSERYQGDGPYKLNIEGLSKGLYMVIVNGKNSVVTKKLIVN
jgi:hypothetical protein